MERSTIKQSPTMALAGGTSNSLGQYIADNRLALQTNEQRGRGFNYEPIGDYLVPNQFGNGTWFRGGFNNIINSQNGNAFWNAPNVAALPAAQWSNARHLFSVGTCSGCHGRETGTGFLHVIPHNPGEQAGLSLFLSGSHTVSDPVTGASRTFNTMAGREEDLSWLATGGAVGTPVFKNYYEMVFATGGRCLDSEGNNSNENALVKAYSCHGNANQRLVLVPLGTATTPTQGVQSLFNMTFKHSGKCLDVQNDSTSSGAKLVQRTCDGTNSQKVWLSGTNGPTYNRLFHFMHSDLCLMVENLNTADATQVVQAACTYADAQGFKFVE
jgi:hypothetical protein